MTDPLTEARTNAHRLAEHLDQPHPDYTIAEAYAQLVVAWVNLAQIRHELADIIPLPITTRTLTPAPETG